MGMRTTVQGSQRRLRGSATMEYAVLISVVAAALTAMGVYVQRSIQAQFKKTEQRMNAEACPPGGCTP